MKHLLSLLLLLLTCTGPARSQELWQLGRYDENNGGLQGHTTQLLQDRSGLLWIATWNGLSRFDGYEFRQIKPQAGDGSPMQSDRIRDIWLADNGDIYCRVDEEEIYRFDMRTYHFCQLSGPEELQQAEQQRREQTTRGVHVQGTTIYIDPQGLEWQLRDNALYCMSRIEQPAQPLPTELPSRVRCLAHDQQGRIWVTTKQDATVRLLDASGRPLGYLGAGGHLSTAYQQFADPVYCFTQTRRGDIWLGCKPGGLFRLRETGSGQFSVQHIDGLECTSVYDIAEDAHGRLWVATLGGGLAVVEQPEADVPTVLNQLPAYPPGKCLKTRFLHITPDGTLLATATDGLLVARIEKRLADMHYHRHTREPDRPTSLSCNATMDIVQMPSGQLFVSTETGGVCEVTSDDLTADTLSFRHYDMAWGLPTDMTISMALNEGRLMVTSNTQFMLIDTYRGTVESFGQLYFHHPYYFSEAQPLRLADGRWLFGTEEGAFFLPQSLMHKSTYQPPLVLTAIELLQGSAHTGTRSNQRQMLAAEHLDTLLLSPRERSLTIHFAALDYTAPQAISYQFRLGGDSTAWNNIGHNRSVTLLDLKPGTYQLALRSTNADGQWTQNTRTLTIIAQPTFWETPWALLLMVLAIAAVVGAVVYTLLYIRRIEHQRQDTLQKYMQLLEEVNTAASGAQGEDTAPADATDADPFRDRLLAFVEQNIGNSNADVAQMAEACAVSRSVLQRRLKQLMGVTPADFLREARLKRACHLLLQRPDLTVSEVAYSCGFSDPKYFSRCFRQSVGQSPTDYREKNTAQ